MLKTLHDHLLNPENDWPQELEPIDGPLGLSARCTCGKESTPPNFVCVKPEGLSIAKRIPGRIRRNRMRGELRAMVAGANKKHLRDLPEASPCWACLWCVGAFGYSYAELNERLGGTA